MIQLAICADCRFIPGLVVTLASIAAHTSRDQMQVTIIALDIDDKSRDALFRTADRCGLASEIIQGKEDAVRGLRLQRWMSRAAYLKLLAPELVNGSEGRLIVLDADLLVLRDLRDLWNADMCGELLMAAQDYGCPYVSSSFGIKNYAALGMSSDSPYFNSGVMLLDVNRWRAEAVTEACVSYLSRHAADLRCHDQEALNAVAVGRCALLDPRWNQMPHIYAFDGWQPSPYKEIVRTLRAEIIEAPWIVHFAGRSKPWFPDCTHPARELFLRYLKDSGWKDRTRTSGLKGPIFPTSVGASRAGIATEVASCAAEPAPRSSRRSEPDFRETGGQDLDEERFRVFDVTVVPAGPPYVLVESSHSGVMRIMRSEAVQRLFRCKEFATLEAHASRIASSEEAVRRRVAPTEAKAGALARFRLRLRRDAAARTSGLPSEDVNTARCRSQLAEFVHDGFLVSEREIDNLIAEAITGRNQPASLPLVGTLGVPTRDRPELLERALVSYVTNFKSFGRNCSVAVVDDSRSPASAAAAEGVCNRIAASHLVDVKYVGREQRYRFARELAAASDVPVEVIEFAIVGDSRCKWSHGAARNTLQLLSAGSTLVQVDDDTVCRMVRCVTPEIGFSSQASRREEELWFLPDKEITDGLETVEADYLALHEHLLGARPSDLQAGDQSGRIFGAGEAVTSELLAALRHPKSAVAVTIGGGIGDSGLRNWTRLFLRGGSFERLVANENLYRARLATRSILRLSPEWRVGNGRAFIAMNIGLDNRQLLPPFMPVQRAEDRIFIQLLRRCGFPALSGYLPYAIEHDPQGRPAADRTTFDHPWRHYRVNDVLHWLLDSQSDLTSGADFGWNLVVIGKHLIALSECSLPHFQQAVRVAGARALMRAVAELERLLADREGRPSWWANDARLHSHALRFAATCRELAIPCDLDGNPDERSDLLRELVGKFGHVLVHWAAIWSSAVHLMGNTATGSALTPPHS